MHNFQVYPSDFPIFPLETGISV